MIFHKISLNMGQIEEIMRINTNLTVTDLKFYSGLVEVNLGANLQGIFKLEPNQTLNLTEADFGPYNSVFVK